MAMKVAIKKVGLDDIYLIEEFLKDAGNSLTTFRYFATRPLTIIKNHLITALLMENNKPVGYCHLDIEGDNIWLGIAVAEMARGKGYGNQLMAFLKVYWEESRLERIKLTVDGNNEVAIELYKKFGFAVVKELAGQPHVMEYHKY
jgi:ribosomal protein S18 acetylase RimI-like enzyme